VILLDRQVEQSLEQALAVPQRAPAAERQAVSSGREVSLELMKRENCAEDRVPWKLSSNNAWRFSLTGFSSLDVRGTVVAESAGRRSVAVAGACWQEVQSAAVAQTNHPAAPPQGELLTLPSLSGIPPAPWQLCGGAALIPRPTPADRPDAAKSLEGPAPAAPVLQPRQSQPLPTLNRPSSP